MNICKLKITAALTATLIAPSAANAQFGGFMKHLPVPGMSHTPSAGAVDPDAFIADGIETAKIVYVAAYIMHMAVQNKLDIAAASARAKDVGSATDVKELQAQNASFQTDTAALSDTDAMVSNIDSFCKTATPVQRQLVASAVLNFAIGMAHNAQLVAQSPGLLSTMASHPEMLGKIGELRGVAAIVKSQAGSIGSFAGALPRLIASTKVKAPDAPAASKAVAYNF